MTTSLAREIEPRRLAARPVVDVDVGDRGQHLVAVVAVVVLGLGAGLQAQVEASEGREQVPLELQQGVAFAGAERAEGDDRVAQLLAVLVEGGVDEAVVLEHL